LIRFQFTPLIRFTFAIVVPVIKYLLPNMGGHKKYKCNDYALYRAHKKTDAERR
jgi:hypothetical protein